MSQDRAVAQRRHDLGVFLRWLGAAVVLFAFALTFLTLPFQLFAVRTGSMSPTFGPRALVVVHVSDFVQGQPITFTHAGDVITHRYMSMNPDGTILTQGDANETPDPWTVRPDDVVGGVVLTAPGLGYWLVYLKSAVGSGSVIFAVIGLCLLWPLGRELDAARDAARAEPAVLPAPPSTREGAATAAADSARIPEVAPPRAGSLAVRGVHRSRRAHQGS